MMEASYVANKGTHLLFPRDLNQVPPQLLGPGNAQLERPYPQFQGITTRYNDANWMPGAATTDESPVQ